MNLAAALGPQSETRVVTCSRAIMMAVRGSGPLPATSVRGPGPPRQFCSSPGGQRPTGAAQTLSQDLRQREREREREIQTQRDRETFICSRNVNFFIVSSRQQEA